VPDRFSRAEAADRFTIFDDVRDDVNFRMAIHEAAAGFLHGRPIKRTKTPAECDQVIITQRLTTKQQYEVLNPRAVNAIEVAVRYRP